jgi:hypothetical protein
MNHRRYPNACRPAPGGITASPKSVVTSLAGFESSTGLGLSEPVVTSMAGFAGDLRPQPTGGRSAIPTDTFQEFFRRELLVTLERPAVECAALPAS